MSWRLVQNLRYNLSVERIARLMQRMIWCDEDNLIGMCDYSALLVKARGARYSNGTFNSLKSRDTGTWLMVCQSSWFSPMALATVASGSQRGGGEEQHPPHTLPTLAPTAPPGLGAP